MQGKYPISWSIQPTENVNPVVAKYLKGYKDEAVNDKDGKQGH